MFIMCYVVDWIDIYMYRVNCKLIHIQSVPNFSFGISGDQFSNPNTQRHIGIDQGLNN